MITPAILRLNEVSTLLGLSPRSIAKKVKKGELPQPVWRGGPNSEDVGWLYAEVIAYKSTYIDPFREHQGSPDPAKTGSGQGSSVDGYPSKPLLRGDSEHASPIKNAEHQETPKPQRRTNPRKTGQERPKVLDEDFVRDVQESGRYGNGRGGFGLSLLVKPTETEGLLSKSWSQRIRIDGRETNLGLGSYPTVSLAAAQRRALANRQPYRLAEIPESTLPRSVRLPPRRLSVALRASVLNATAQQNGRQVSESMCIPYSGT